MSESKPFLVRLTPSQELLAQAAKENEVTKASLINESIKNYLGKDINRRLDQLK
jgi:hypothetical protein